MTIAIDASRANRPNRTGVEWYSYHVIQELKKIIPDNHRVVLYTNERLRDGLEKCPNGWQEKVLRWPPKYLWTQIRLWWELLTNAPDILFVPAHTIPFLPIRKKTKIVVCVHDVGFKRFPELYKPIQVWYHDLTMRKIRSRANIIITISQFSRQEMIDLYHVNPEKIKIIYLGYDKSRYNNSVISKNNDNRYLLFVGRIEKKKNILNMVKAFNLIKDKYPDLKLVFVGNDGNQSEQLNDFIRDNGLENKVILSGYVSEGDLPGMIKGAELFLFPTLYEGFGLPIIQAMALGTPVVTSDMNPHREVASDAAFFINPFHLDDLANSIDQLLSDSDLRQTFIKKGLERSKIFSWQKTANDIWLVLASL